MAHKIGEHWQGDTKVTWRDDGDKIGVHYSQNIDPVLAKVARINAEGGMAAQEGMGRLLYEFPVTLIMEHALERGIPYEGLVAKIGFEDEWHAMGRKWSKLTVDGKRQYYSVSS